LIVSTSSTATASGAAVWEQVDPRPPARSFHALAHDISRNRIVLFGGSSLSTGLVTGDTWEWDGRAWVDVTPAVGPPARRGHAMTYDGARRRVVLFGGRAQGSGAYLSDTWEWDGREWTEVTPAVSPSPRAYHALAYDSDRDRVVMYGGFTAAGGVSETWE